MSPEVAAKIFKATEISPTLLELIAKTPGRGSRTYKVQVLRRHFLPPGGEVGSLKGQPIHLYQDEQGVLVPAPFFPDDAPVEEEAFSFGAMPRMGDGPKWKKTLKALSAYNDDKIKDHQAKKWKAYIPAHKDTGNGIECPVCALEMKDQSWDTLRVSTPSTIAIICSCGYDGRRNI